ncbi:MAG: amidase family protein, partial [Nocardioidaceae bacterium]
MTSARESVEYLLDRIFDIDSLVNAVCTLNVDAADQAAALDAEAAADGSRGPLHGQAALIKDNTDTADMLTTAGSLALTEKPPPTDAALVRRMRAAGMVVVGKTNLSEWSNLRDHASTSGWSAYGGQTRNPYGLNRSPGGSSSGSAAAVAAGMAPYAIGTETDGSITCAAAYCGCVGLKPTVGLVPTAGVVPISWSQDSPGPMTRSVYDAAALLSVLADNGTDYASHASDGRLAGKRIGVPRKMFWGYSPLADAAAERAVEMLAAQGATIVDGTDLLSMVDCGSDDELQVLVAEMEVGIGRYLAARTEEAPKTLSDVVAFNRARAEEELLHFGQSFFEMALEAPGVDTQEYKS